ncbi:hypothetical protein PFISCL1PPCAC_3792, partial [Pristionchus fissidentatus]
PHPPRVDWPEFVPPSLVDIHSLEVPENRNDVAKKRKWNRTWRELPSLPVRFVKYEQRNRESNQPPEHL